MTMIEKSYQNVETVPLEAGFRAEDLVAINLALIEGVIVHSGFAKEAAEKLNLTITQHRLTLTEEERRGGASHCYSDGEIFTAVNISPNVSPFVLGGADTANPTKMSVEQQTAYLAYVLGTSLFPKIDEAVGFISPDDYVSTKSGSVLTDPHTMATEVCSRQDPTMITLALREMLKIRLKNLVPQDAPAATSTSSKKNNGPKF